MDEFEIWKKIFNGNDTPVYTKPLIISKNQAIFIKRKDNAASLQIQDSAHRRAKDIIVTVLRLRSFYLQLGARQKV